LVRQAYSEALAFQLEEFRLRAALQRIVTQTIILKEIDRPTPFAFPIMVDSLGRERLTTETLEERITRMTRPYEMDGIDEQKNKKENRKNRPSKRGF
jgi:ATP-dependent Lhr-like helicase